MKTLYDLIGALADDDAEELRAAFLKAVKANHPDVNPDNPEAEKQFRRIVRANAILSDRRQREAYDRLLASARRQEQEIARRKAIAADIRRLGLGVVTGAATSAMLIAGYILLKPVDTLPLASVHVTEISRGEPPQAAAVNSTELYARERADPGDHFDIEAGIKPDAPPRDSKEQTGQDGTAFAVAMIDTAPAADASAPRESGPKDVKYYRERAVSAYRNGDLSIALVNFDLAIQHDPACSDCYLERGIVLHRMGDRKGAFSDVAEAKRIDGLNRGRSPSGAGAH